MKHIVIVVMLITSVGLVSCTNEVEKGADKVNSVNAVDEVMVDDVVGGLLNDVK